MLSSKQPLQNNQNVAQMELASDLQRKAAFIRPLVIGLSSLHGFLLLVMILKATSTLVDFIQIGLAFALYLVVFFLNQKGKTLLATHLLCQVFNAEMFFYLLGNLGLLGDSTNADVTLVPLFGNIMALTILLAGMLISRRAIIAFLGLNTALVVTAFFVVSQLGIINNPEIIIGQPTIIFCFTCLLAIISWLYHTTMERSNRHLNLVRQEVLRMGAELDVSKRIQQMLLPSAKELQHMADIDIVGFMEPSAEVGGDYYDVIRHNGQIKIGIGT